ERVVVPDLERANAGLLGIARLQGGDDAAGFVAQAAHLVERGVVAGAHEAAVALDQGQLVGERARKLAGERRIGLAQRRLRRRDLAALLARQRVETLRKPGCSTQAVADGGEVARAAAADHKAGEGAGEGP